MKTLPLVREMRRVFPFAVVLIFAFMSKPLMSQTFYKIDFETDGSGNPLLLGEVVDDATYAAKGISFESSGKPLVIFDSSNPTGDDPDLGTPSENCPSCTSSCPGESNNGGGVTNCTPMGNILIIEENFTDNNGDGRDDVPDDNAGGGVFTITFANPTHIHEIAFVDDITVDISGTKFGGGTFSDMVNLPGDNDFYSMDYDEADVQTLTFDLDGSGGIAYIMTSTTSLPVTLHSFRGSYSKQNHIDLSWITSTEINNSHFVIERSIDGQTFSEIGSVQGHGSTVEVHSYSFRDFHARRGNNYYRLRQVDMDGGRTYSEVIMVRKETSSELDVAIFPNPIRQYLTVKTNTLQDKSILRLFRIDGQLVWERAFNGTVFQFDLSDLEAGNYILQVFSDEQTVTRKIVKL